MRRSTERILTTHPGRLPDPPNRDAALEARARGDQATFDALVKAGAAEMFERQRRAGIDIMSDGEFWKTRDAGYYCSRATGIEVRPAGPGEHSSILATQRERLSAEWQDFYSAYDQLGNIPRPGVTNGNRPGARAALVGPVTALPPSQVEHEVAVIKEALKESGVAPEEYFYPVLGPGWLDHFVWNDYYQSEEEYVFALAEIIRNDFKTVVEAGLTLQIDDPGLCDRWGMIHPEPSYEEYRRQESIRVEATNWALKGIPEEQVRYHTCWGSWHTPHTTDIPFDQVIDLMLRVNAGAYSIEAADVAHERDYLVWENYKLPDGKVFMPGVVAHKTTTIEPPELVEERIVRWANMFGRENVVACVDCGVGGRSYPEVGWAKLKALSEGAALATKQLW